MNTTFNNGLTLSKFEKFNDTDLEQEQADINCDKNKNYTEEITVINKLVDEMGFSRYHYLVFTITALILICGGVQELMLAIVLSMINQKEKLSSYHLALITTSEYIGYTTASLLVNIVTNFISSRRLIQLFAVLSLILTGISMYTLGYYPACISRFFTGICLGMIDILIYLNLIEICPTKIRGFIGSIIFIFFPLGQVLISIFSYFELNYTNNNPEMNFRYLLLIPFLIIALLLLLLLPYLQESARSKNINGNVDTVHRISKFNKDDDYLKNKQQLIIDMYNSRNKGDKELSIDKCADKGGDRQRDTHIIQKNNLSKDSLKAIATGGLKKSHTMFNFNTKKKITPNTIPDVGFINQLKSILTANFLQYTVIFWILSAATGFVNNGIFFLLPTTAPKLESKAFISVVLSVSMEIPSNFLVSVLIENKSIGRLRILKIGYFLTILVCVTCLLIGYDYLIINCLLKFFIAIPTNVLIVYGSEIYNKSNRTFGVSTINFWRRLATVLSPFVISYLDNKFGDLGPFFIFTPLTIFSFLFSLILSIETRGVPLDEVI